MSDHRITWDHTECDPEDDCNPRGVITCLAVGEGESMCRLQEVNPVNRNKRSYYDYCDSWSLCDASDSSHAMCPDFEHHDPGGQHCTEGHPIRLVNYCNVIEWISNSDGEAESCIGGWPPEFKDGPIDVDWTGEGYLWSYAEPVAEQVAK